MFYNSKQRAYMWKESVVYKKKNWASTSINYAN